MNAEPSDSKASLINEKEYALDEGNNTIELVVTAEDGSKKTYTVNVNREKKIIEDEPAPIEPSKEETEKKPNNYIVPIIIGVAVIIVGIIVAIILRKKKKTEIV